MKTRVLLVDDEPLARERLRQLLEQEPDFELVGECADGASAVRTIRSAAPDLVLLDVQMPEMDGFAVLEQLTDENLPAVIFVTAFDQFALKAFDVHAVDFLLKPFHKERFHRALQRALEQVRHRKSGALTERLRALLAEVRRTAEANQVERLPVRSGGSVVFIRMDDIDWVEAGENGLLLHVGKEVYLHRETLVTIEAQLSRAKFMRINRSTLVQVDRIQELQPLFHGDYTVLLRDGTRLTLSRTYREKLDQLLGRTQ